MVQPIITLVVAFSVIVVLQLFSKNKKKLPFLKRWDKNMDNEETAQRFINVKDIRKNFLYTNDNMIFSYIRVYPIDINLLTRKEEESKSNILTKEISSLQRDFKFIAVSKPTDISFAIQELQDILVNSTDHIQKEILRKEILSMSDYATSGEAMERQFYIILYEEYDDGIENEMLKTTADFISAFSSIGIKTEVLKERDIYQLSNLINNPRSSNEEVDISSSICVLES